MIVLPKHIEVIMNVKTDEYTYIWFQSIPADMDFDPNSNPPCYKTKDEVGIASQPICSAGD